jgi:phage shock protein E
MTLMRRLLIPLITVLALASPLAWAQGTLPERTVLIDVRTPEEFAAGHIPGALNMPYSDIVRLTAAAGIDRNTALALYCRSGRRSAIAESELRANGFVNVENLGAYEAVVEALRSCDTSNC